MKLKPIKKGVFWNGMEVKFTNTDGSAKDLTGCTFVAKFKTNPSGAATFEFSSTTNTIINDAPLTGVITFVGRAMNYPATNYYWDLDKIDALGKVETIPDVQKTGEQHLIWQIVQDVS